MPAFSGRIVTRNLALLLVALAMVAAPLAAFAQMPQTGPATLPSTKPSSLLDRRVPGMTLDIPLIDAIDRLAEITKTKIIVDWNLIESAHVPKDIPVKLRLYDVPLGGALRAVLESVGGNTPFDFSEQDGVVRISTAAYLKAQQNRPITIVYDVSDLFRAGIELRQRLSPTTMPTIPSKTDEGPYSVKSALLQEQIDDLTAVLAPSAATSPGQLPESGPAKCWAGTLVVKLLRDGVRVNKKVRVPSDFPKGYAGWAK